MKPLKQRVGILFVISAPSGTGKSTVAESLMASMPGLSFSVSYTTRSPRAAEKAGRAYHFVDKPRFEAMIAENSFLEWAAVYDNLYGTGLDDTRSALAEGRDLLLDIDVQGAQQARRARNQDLPVVTVMILPPSYGTLKQRLTSRGSETPETLGRRLAEARGEMEQYSYFDYLVINDEVDGTVDQIASIVRAERRRTEHCDDQALKVIASFPS
jgi:guanylate kinase